jgi:pimeloyl-ACP methyl ester carboxylesterase
MPYAVNQGVRIHYRIEGDGQPLVLQHGFTDSLETWYETGYVEGLKTDYRADPDRRPWSWGERQAPRVRRLRPGAICRRYHLGPG